MIGSRTPGPIHLFVQTRYDSGPAYLGTCVQAPEPEHQFAKIPIMNDVAGRSEPFQIVKDGENARIMASMNRFDYTVCQFLRALTSTPPGVGPASVLLAGSELPLTRGTMTMGISDFQLYLLNEYAGTASAGVFPFAPGTGDLPTGRTYFSVQIDAYKESTVGTRVLEVAIAFKATSLYNPSLRSFSGVVGGTVPAGLSVDTVPAGLPALIV